MTKIKDIVEIDSKAVLSNAIQLAWYADPAKKEENDRLVSGYVFGNNIHRRVGNYWESSSLPIFEQIRQSFGNPQASNIFTVVASYGHGKSHFALVLANYFGLEPDSPVIEDIINHIENCSDAPTAEHFRTFKNPPQHFQNQTRRPQLVVALAGTDFHDLRQGFLQALRRALDANENTRSLPIKSLSTKAAEWLKDLSADALEKADVFLNEKYDTDVDSLIAALEKFESGKEVIVKDLSRIFNNGYALDFGADANLKEIIEDTVNTLCKGDNAPFYGMLILFDELGVYAEKWCHHRIASGGFALQEIFEACAKQPSKICFVGFVQRELGEFVKNYSINVQTEFEKLSSRMHTDAVYHLVSNLEEVIGNIILKRPEWRKVIEDFSPRLLEESTISRESIGHYFENWEANRFYNTVTRDCFPLHPMTTGLLCRFDFTASQRTIIGAVNSMFKLAQENAVSDGEKLKWIRPTELVKEFEQDFTKNNSRAFADYTDVIENALTTDAEPILLDISQALFLFKEAKMTKQNRYEHAELLAHLAGYTIGETKDALKRLQEDFNAVSYSRQKQEYEFSSSADNRKIVLDMAAKAIVGKPRLDGLVKLLERLNAFETLEESDTFNPKNNSQASDFKSEFAVEGDEWFLAPRYLDAARLSPDEVKKLCKKTAEETAARGTVIYLISGVGEELSEMREYAATVFRKLKEEKYAHPFVIAIPSEPAAQLEKQLLIKNYLVNEMSQPDKVRFAESRNKALEYTNKELNDELIAHIRSVEYFVPEELILKFGNQNKTLDEIADALFTEAYKFRAPSKANLMKISGTKGNTATAEIAKQLIVNQLNSNGLDRDKQNVVNFVLMDGSNRWGILDASYKIREPKHPLVKQAWSFLNNSISKDAWTTFDGLISKLMQPPFGYDDFTATFLIAAWIGKHKHEVAFKDNRIAQPMRATGVLPQNGIQANLTLGELQNNLNRSKEFIKFLRSNVSVQNSGQEIQRIAKEYLSQIQNVKDGNEGSELFQQAGQILQTLAPGDELIPQINEALKDLAEFLKETENVEKSLSKYREIIASANDVSSLIRTQNSLNSFGKENKMLSNPAFVETLKLAENKIETVARGQSQAVLKRIESYDSIRDNLEKSRQVLSQAGRADLVNLFTTALEKIENDYQHLQKETNEKPILAQINAIQTSGVSLANLLENLRRLEEILASNSSKNIEKAAHLKQEEINGQVKNARSFVEKLSARVNSIKDIGAGEELQREIYQKQNRYEETPEAKIVAELQENLATRISELKAENERIIKEKNEQRRRDLENLTAQKIAGEFQKINDSELQFNCLKEMLNPVGNLKLSEDQKRTLIGLLS